MANGSARWCWGSRLQRQSSAHRLTQGRCRWCRRGGQRWPPLRLSCGASAPTVRTSPWPTSRSRRLATGVSTGGSSVVSRIIRHSGCLPTNPANRGGDSAMRT